MDYDPEEFSTVMLSPIPESIGEKTVGPDSRSIFDPPGDSEIRSEQLDSEPPLTSEPTTLNSSFSHRESEGVVTRSKSRRASVASDCGFEEAKEGGKLKNIQRVSKGTQVMPRMLSKKRSTKKTGVEDAESKENKPPRAPPKRQRQRPSKDGETLKKPKTPPAPKKKASRQEDDCCNISGTGVKRRLSASSPMNTDEEHPAPSESTIHETPGPNSSDLYPSDSLYGINSLAEDEDNRGENIEGKMVVPTSLDDTVLSRRSSPPLPRQIISHPSSQTGNPPMALILDQDMFQEGGTIEIKMLNGMVQLKAKHDESAAAKKTERKDKKEKRRRGMKSKGRRNSRKNYSTSESDSSCSSSSHETECSCCSCCDDYTSSSSSESDCCRSRRTRR